MSSFSPTSTPGSFLAGLLSVEHLVQLSGCSQPTEWIQQRPAGQLGLEHAARKQSLRQLGLLSPEKRRLQVDLLAMCHYLVRSCGEDRVKLFLRVQSNRARGSRHQLRHRTYSPGFGKK